MLYRHSLNWIASSHLWVHVQRNERPAHLTRGQTWGSQSLPPTLMNHPPNTTGKTPLVRSSNKHNASPGGCKFQFSRNKVERWSFFLDGKSFPRCCEEQHSYILQFIERWWTVTKAHSPQVKSLLLQDWFYQRPTAINHILIELQPQNVQRHSSISNGKRKRKKAYKQQLSWLSFSQYYASFSLVYLVPKLISHTEQESGSQMHYISASII